MWAIVASVRGRRCVERRRAGGLAPGRHPLAGRASPRSWPWPRPRPTGGPGSSSRGWPRSRRPTVRCRRRAGWPSCWPSARSLLHRRSRPLGALVGAIAAQVLLRLELDDAGASALVTFVAVSPVLVSAYIRSSRRAQRRIRVAVVALAGLAVVAAAGLAFAAVQVSSTCADAANNVRDGLEALRDNEPDRAVTLLVGATEDFEAAQRPLGTWGGPARLVPVLGHQARATAVVADEGAALAETAAAGDGRSRHRRAASSTTACLDLDLVARFEAPLADAVRGARRRLGARSPKRGRCGWSTRCPSAIADFGTEVDRALPDAELAIEGVRLAPALFGGDGPRHYFIAFTQPAESRGLGGFVGNFGELTAVDGDLELTRSGRIRELIAAPGAASGPSAARPTTSPATAGSIRPSFLQDLTFSPDGPSVAQVMEELYPQAGGREVDGVIIVDPVALAALMEFTGPDPRRGLGRAPDGGERRRLPDPRAVPDLPGRRGGADRLPRRGHRGDLRGPDRRRPPRSPAGGRRPRPRRRTRAA